MLDLAHLRSFVALASELHFGRAAQQVNMTQPPFSRQIKKLEEHLGVSLFERTSHSVKLTQEGHQLLPRAEEIIRQSVEIEQTAKQSKGTKRGEISIGFYAAASFGFLPRLMLHASKKYPNISVSLKEMTTIQQLEALTFGDIDLGLMRPTFSGKQFMAKKVMREELIAAIPLNNPLARHQQLTLEDINNEPFIMYHPDAPYMHDLLSRAFQQAGIYPPVVQSMTNAQAIMALVSVGMGVAIIPEHARFASFDKVIFRPIQLPSDTAAELQVIYRKDARNPVISCFRDLASDIGKMSF